ncbi:MAG: metallophosphoesterase [Lachnospiraceae bacterium]|nr:metallophosphoesterase [Lachnospiraceae bacterium]
MNYVISDIHNDNKRLNQLLKTINFGKDDHLFVLGDLFDRCVWNPDPVGVYFTILGLRDRCTVIQGNHDVWLAKYIMRYINSSKRQRRHMDPYYYNSFELVMERLTVVDALQLAEFVLSCPLQYEFSLKDKNYLFGHAMTSHPDIQEEEIYYLMGGEDESFYTEGIDRYISICGHTETGFMRAYGGTYSYKTHPSIWRNDKRNVIIIDCGCGFEDGMLGCLCLDTEEEYYI